MRDALKGDWRPGWLRDWRVVGRVESTKHKGAIVYLSREVLAIFCGVSLLLPVLTMASSSSPMASALVMMLDLMWLIGLLVSMQLMPKASAAPPKAPPEKVADTPTAAKSEEAKPTKRTFVPVLFKMPFKKASAKVAEPEVAYEKEGQDLTMAARRLRHAIRCATYIQARYRGRCDRVQEGASRNVWA